MVGRWKTGKILPWRLPWKRVDEANKSKAEEKPKKKKKWVLGIFSEATFVWDLGYEGSYDINTVEADPRELDSAA